MAAPPLVGAPLRVHGSFWLAAGSALRRYDAATGRLRAQLRWPGWQPTAGPVLLLGARRDTYAGVALHRLADRCCHWLRSTLMRSER